MTNELHPGEVLTAGQPLTVKTRGQLCDGDLLLTTYGKPEVRVHRYPNDNPDYRLPHTIWIGRPNAEGWIDAPEGGWKTNPVPGCRVDVRHRGYQGDGVGYLSDDQQWQWDCHPGHASNILSFRLSASDEGCGSRPSDVPTEGEAEGAGFDPDAEALARAFHETYEHLAPSFGYETRPDTKAFDPKSANGRLMIAVCASIRALAHPQEAASVPGGGVGEKVYVSSALADEMTFLVRRLRQKGDLASADLLQSYQWRVREIEFATHPAREDGPAAPTKEPA